MSTALGASKLCVEVSRACQEPLAGTAAHAPVVLAVEERGAWAPKAIDSRGLEGIRDVLKDWIATLGARLQLIRTPERCAGPRRVYVCRPGHGARLAMADLHDGEFASFDIQSALDNASDTSMLHLVCTHGKRDRCCALEGGAYFRARESHPDVWMTSHLGGHRFAATTLTLPGGLCHGRLSADNGEGPFDSLPASQLRGRVCYAPPTQVAELALMAHQPEASFKLEGEEVEGERATAEFSAGGARHRVVLRREARPPQVLSCGDVEKERFAWRVERLDA